jgi:hypothetical protein
MAGYELHDDGLRPKAHDRAIRHFAEPTSVVCYCRQPHDEANDQEEDIAPGRAEPSEAGIEQAVVLLDLLRCMIEDDEEIRDRPKILDRTILAPHRLPTFPIATETPVTRTG